jgi:Putative MetA-pathway of phenol degradation
VKTAENAALVELDVLGSSVMKSLARKVALLAAVSILALAGTAEAKTRVSFSTGLDYSSGEYGGTETTEVISAPFGVRFAVDDWTFRASSSYLQVTGPADVSEDGESGEGVGAVTRMGTESGFGDTTVSVERAFRHIGGTDAYVELSARARLPTGDENAGLGVGATDYSVVTEAGVSTRSGGFHLSVGYRFLGQRDEGPERQDGLQAGAGAWLPLGRRTRLGVYGNWREASVEGNDDPANAGAYVSYRATQRLRLTFTAGGGLSDASPEFVTGIRFSWLPGARDD